MNVWIMVPREPTPEMLAHIVGQGLENLSDEHRTLVLLRGLGVYRAMLAAAPAASPPAAPQPPEPPFAKGSWQHAVDDALVSYMKTSHDFATPHDAVKWLLQITAAASAAPQPDLHAAITDEQIDKLWLYRTNLHGGDIMPQLRDFARSLLAADTPQQPNSASVYLAKAVPSEDLPPALAKSDRQLLKLAAKASGYWSAEFGCVDALPHPLWDPLVSDTDAFRLAVWLGLEIGRGIGGSVYAFRRHDCCGISEDLGSDPYAATRRAIVRAAAVIGVGPVVGPVTQSEPK